MHKSILFLMASLSISFSSLAQDVECTQASREQWMKTDEMKKKAEFRGYKIKKFMTLEKCYEITGEVDGKKVVHLFNPVDGTLVNPSAPPPAIEPLPSPEKK